MPQGNSLTPALVPVCEGELDRAYEIEGKLDAVKQGGNSGWSTPLSRCARHPPCFAGGIL